ncbi:MBL fold metallo-hydrolase [Stella sp.]|uniref:MBL fold metallo-hydrolase n=1 Tax=Stella sp. TaxID=2912054 RepID=UPI0035B29D80
MSVRFRFLGCGDAFGSGGRFQTCFHLAGSSGAVLIDCGASSMVAIRRFGVDPNAIDAVLVTHLHGDHFAGLPFFLLDAQLVSRRTRPLAIAGPPGLKDRLGEAMEVLFPGSSTVERRFAVTETELPAGVATAVGPVRVTPYEMVHWCGAPPYALRVELDGRVVTYTGDTEWVDAIVLAARDADLFVAEAYFHDRRVKYHLDWATLARHLPTIGAKRVVLTHFSPDMLGRVAPDGVELAEDGLELAL